jgi:hypothetical protein
MLSGLYVQVAGVEGRHIVLLLADNNITDEAMLADVNGLLNTGEVTGEVLVNVGSWPDNQHQTQPSSCL